MKKILFVMIFSLLCNLGTSSFADTPNLSDTETARIDLVSLSNRNIEVSKGPSELLATITASDNLNNIGTVFFGIYRAADPFPTQVNFFPIQTSTEPIKTSVINNRVVSIFQFKVTLPKGLASGDYYIYSFAKDAVGNYPQTGPCDKYCNISEMAKYPESTFVIKNDSTGQTIDVTELDVLGQIKILQSKYDSLLNDNNSLTASYEGLLVANKSLSTNYENELAAKAKMSEDLKASLVLIAESDKKLKLADDSRQSTNNDLVKLRSEVGSLNVNIKSLKAQLAAANKKLSTVCKNKPKPKGC